MAALPETPDLRVVDLRKISVAELAPVLTEEGRAWRAELNWDLSSSVELIERFISMQALNGCALLLGGRVIGYAYFVRDEHKGLIGDLYVAARERTREREAMLVEAALAELWRSPGLRRVEAQLLMIDAAGPKRPKRMPFADWFRAYPRTFFELQTERVSGLPERVLSNIKLTPWRESRYEESAWLVTAAYRGHIDSEINDQYRSPGGARRFLTNIVQFPGCGTFFAPAAFAAFDRGGTLCGMSLASLVAGDSGHITQICVAPSHKGMGVGYELLRRSLLALTAHGCRTVSLTVTSANQQAIRLYEGMGFVRKREFSAWVWDCG